MSKLLKAREIERRRSPSRSRPTSRRTGCGRISSRRSVSPSGPPTASCGIRCISGCATTRARRKWSTGGRRFARSQASCRSRRAGPPSATASAASARSDRSAARARGRAQGRRARRCPTATGSRSPTSRSCSGPTLKITKGDLLRYYVEVSPYLLPSVEDRPLVMKRFPNGVGGKAFYQQRSREERPPAGVRIETLDDGSIRSASRTRSASSADR